MPRYNNQKLKLLYLHKIFHEKTDAEHGLSIKEIIELLELESIHAERKSLYEDFQILSDFGMEITANKGKTTTYYGESSGFQMPELKLLVDAVQSSKFITKKKSRSLIKQIQSLCSEYQAQKLQSQVNVSARVKTSNENIYYNVDNIYTAITENKKINFNYFEYSLDKTEKIKRNGTKYIVSPMALIWDDENYYLVAYEDDKLKHYRVDKMKSLEILAQERENTELFTRDDMAKYSEKVFSMFAGETEKVKINFDNKLIGVVIDRFGKEIIISRENDESFNINVDIDVSTQFYAWLAGFGDKAKIISPQKVKQGYIEHLTKAINAQ